MATGQLQRHVRLVHDARRRAAVQHFRASGSFIEALTAAVMRTGTSATRFATAGTACDTAHVDSYCDDSALTRLVRAFRLVEDTRVHDTLPIPAV